ncbi:hypothetical protein QQP08_012478 [Theobroma cacao]|nr:hypothetical protein QQP08_012478 [Theobroma cacao]
MYLIGQPEIDAFGFIKVCEGGLSVSLRRVTRGLSTGTISSLSSGSPLDAVTGSRDPFSEDLSPSTESLRDMSCTSLSESLKDNSSAVISSPGVSVCH